MKQRLTLKDILKEKMTEDELSYVNRSFEIVGDIAIVEIAEEISHLGQIVGEGVMKVNTSIKVVLKKSGIHHGEFRTQDLIHIAGENRKETIYVENGCRIKVNPETVYFSSKLSTEREKLLVDLDNKKVLVMFSGSGPYSVVALRKNPNLNLMHSVEINPEGHKYAKENLDLNKSYIKKSKEYEMLKKFLISINKPIIDKNIMSILNSLKVHFVNGDVREITPNMNLTEIDEVAGYKLHNQLFEMPHPIHTYNFLDDAGFDTMNLDFDELEINDDMKSLIVLFLEKFDVTGKINGVTYEFNDELSKSYLYSYLVSGEIFSGYDHVYMPLPKDAIEFLDSAFDSVSNNGVIHMYDFVDDSVFPHECENKILSVAKQFGRKVEILQTRKVGQYSPRKYRVCCDFKVLE